MAFQFQFLTRIFLATVASALVFMTSAQAHDTHGKPQYGGVVAEAGIFQAELVVKQTTVIIYLTEHGKDIPCKGVTGKLTVLDDGKTQSLILQPSSGNQLQATLAAPLKNGKFAAQITLPNKPAVSLRFASAVGVNRDK